MLPWKIKLAGMLLVGALILFVTPKSLTKQEVPEEVPLYPLLSKTEMLFRLGCDSFEQGVYDKAILLFSQFIAAEPESLLLDYAYLYAGMSLMQTAEYAKARSMFQQIQQRCPDSLLLKETAFLTADSYYFEGAYDTAIQQYFALKKAKPYKSHRLLPPIYLKLGHCYEQKKQFKAARDVYHEARLTFITQPIYTLAKDREDALLAQQPDIAKTITTKEMLKDAETFLDAGRTRDADAVLKYLSEQKLTISEQQQVLWKQIQVAYALRENQLVLQHAEKFVKMFPKSRTVPYAFDKMGRVYLREQNMAAFLTIYNRLRKAYPKHPATAEVMRLKGKELEFQGKFKDALTEYQAFLQLFPKSTLVPDILWSIGWMHYRLKQYDAALQSLERLVRSYPRSYHLEEALYWSGQAAEHLQQYTKAGNHYLKLLNSHRHSYYGVLAQRAFDQIIQQRPNLTFTEKPREMKPLEFEKQAQYTQAAALLHRKKADDLSKMRLYRQAAEEVAYAIELDTPDNAKYFELATFYQQAGDYHHLSRLMQRQFWHWFALGDDSLPQQFWEYCYPLSFYEIIEHYTASSELDPLLVVALTFAESIFDPEAYSPAGAMGLMQLMPATGARMAEQIGLPAVEHEQYFRPKVNILLGITYLKTLLPLFKQQIPPIIASYNAGERVVSVWWKEEYQDDVPTFVASIPYQETKRYMQKVLGYYQEYQRVYNTREKEE